jgi:hypothetical protein
MTEEKSIVIKITNLIVNYLEIRHDFINGQLLYEKLLGEEKDKFGANLIDQPNFKQITLPSAKKLIVITPDRKLVIEDVSGELPNKSGLVSYLTKTRSVLDEATSRPTTYGFNYSVLVNQVDKPISIPGILSTLDVGRELTNANILGVGARLIYDLVDRRIDLRVDPNPQDKKQYIANLNAHYELKGEGLPSESEIKRKYIDNWNHLRKLVDRTFFSN